MTGVGGEWFELAECGWVKSTMGVGSVQWELEEGGGSWRSAVEFR